MARSTTTRRRYLHKRLNWFFRKGARHKLNKNAKASNLVRGAGNHSISVSDIQRIQQEIAEE